MAYRRRSNRTDEERDAQVAELRQKLEDQIRTLTTAEGWMNHLHFAKKFRRYSTNNRLLIQAQRPHAEHVASYTTWQGLGRQVVNYDNPIWIYSPPRTKKTGEFEKDARTGEDVEKKITLRPKLQNVYDYADTEPVPTARKVFEPSKVAKPTRLTGEDEAGLADAITAWLVGQGWDVGTETMTGSLNGYTKIDGSKIVRIREDLEPAQRAKTTIHEAAHVLMHAEDGGGEYALHRGFKETEAESVAYVVAGLFGLDTSPYSVHYVAHWSNGDLKVVKAAADSVMAAANTLAKAIDGPGGDDIDPDTFKVNLEAAREASKEFLAAKRAAQKADAGRADVGLAPVKG